jgi:formylglycine-generating enzyme required for sulfatase activity
LLLVALVVVWGVVLRLKTANGIIELVNLPNDAEVLVDGQEVAVTWPGGGKPATVTVKPGKHRIAVKKDGIEISGEEVNVVANGKEKFTVRFVASGKSPHEGPKAYQLESITNSIGMTLTLIPAGEFFMGSPDEAVEAEITEVPSHRVRITKPFYFGVTEVTQAEYESVMGNNPSYFSPKGEGRHRVAGQSTEQLPVECVSWSDAIQFCNKLSEKDGKKPFYSITGPVIRIEDWNGQGYRLPTEAEWEYACRAGTATPTLFSFGDNPLDLAKYGWFRANSDERTHPASKKPPNGFGLHDMHGNVWEWCWDYFDDAFYQRSPTSDPVGPAGPSNRVIRGGSWDNRLRQCRSAHRQAGEGRRHNVGFRIALGQDGR